MKLLSVAYLPPIEWFAHLYHGDAVIEVCDSYVKQTYRNRCHIIASDGVHALNIPVSHDGSMRITEQANWRHQHWHALVSAYRMSPFFDYYADDLQEFYAIPRMENLYEYDLKLINRILRLMHLDLELRLTDHYLTPAECKASGIIDLRDSIHPKKKSNPHFTSADYYQVFASKTGFVGNLSIIDLLFNLGPEAELYLKAQSPYCD